MAYMETLLEANRDTEPVFTLVRKVPIFVLENLGTGDILLAGNIIAAVGYALEPPTGAPTRLVDGSA